MAHIRKVLKINNYEPWMLEIPRSKTHTNQPKNTPGATNKEFTRPLAIPYVKGLSEKLQRIFRGHGLAIYHKPGNTLRQALVRPKDKICKFKKCDTIYKIKCGECNKTYVGETARVLKKRYKEHTRQTPPLSAVGEHIQQTGHDIYPDDITVLDTESIWIRRRVKEALYIKEESPMLNRDRGYELAHIYSHLVSHDLTSSGYVAPTASLAQ